MPVDADAPENGAEAPEPLPPSGFPPISLAETADQYKQVVLSGEADLQADSRNASKGADVTQEASELLQNSIALGLEWMDDAHTHMVAESISDADDLAEKKREIIEHNDIVAGEEYEHVRSYYETVGEFLQNINVPEGEKTAFDFKKEAIKFIATKKSPEAALKKTNGGSIQLTTYAVKNLPDVIGKALDGDGPADAFAMKDTIVSTILADPEIDTSMKVQLESRVQPLILLVAALMHHKEDILQLPKDALYGLIGRVPTKGKKADIFNDPREILALKGNAYSVRVALNGKVREVYINGTGPVSGREGIPTDVWQEILAECDDAVGAHIVDTHYRRDADVRTLFESMDSGQSIEATVRGGSGRKIAIVGTNTSKAVRIEGLLPDGIDTEEFMKTPMKYIEHKFEFFRNNQEEDAEPTVLEEADDAAGASPDDSEPTA